MALVLTGQSSNVTTPLTATVSAIANNGSGAWRVTTSAPHLFGPSDYVELQVTISAAAVIAYGVITVIDAMTFDVAGTTYTATGTGTATDFSLTPQIQVPTDGDSFSLQLSGMLSAFQGIMDRTQWLRYQQVNPPTTTITGVAGTSIAASAGGVPTFITAPFQAIEADLATIKSGSYTDTATRTVGVGGSDTFAAGAYVRISSGGSRLIRRAAGAAPHNATLHTAFFVDIATANEFRYDGGSPAPNDNHLKIREGTSTVQGGLFAGDWIRFVTGPNAAAGQLYTIYREDGTTALAELWGAGQWVELEWNGSQWRYVSSSPWVPNGTAIPGNAAYYGDGGLGTNGVVLYPANL